MTYEQRQRKEQLSKLNRASALAACRHIDIKGIEEETHEQLQRVLELKEIVDHPKHHAMQAEAVAARLRRSLVETRRAVEELEELQSKMKHWRVGIDVGFKPAE